MSERPIPVPAGLAYLPHQTEGVRFILEREATLLADQPGTGKTVTAIGALNASGALNALIVCPASLRLNWKRELGRWLVKPLEVGIAAGRKLPDADIVIASYEFMARHLEPPRQLRWGLLVADEAHLLCGGPKTHRGRGVLGCPRYRKRPPVSAVKASRRLFMTGTPIVNRPIEMQPVLASIDRIRWGDRMRFARRYCAARHNGFGWDFSGASNLDELERTLKETCMLRRLKTGLPPKRWQVVPLPSDGATDALQAERSILGFGDRLERDLSIEALDGKAGAKFSEMAAIRRAIGIAKAPHVVELARRALAGGEKVVIAAHHHQVIDALMGAFEGIAVRIDGRDSATAKDAAVRRFQEDSVIQVCALGIRAGGLGHTLTAARFVICAELDWTPGAMEQVEDRCHRHGQSRDVLVQYAVTDGSIDALVAEKIVAKQRVAGAALDGESLTPAEASPAEPGQLALGF